MESIPRLTYFTGRGRAEKIRLLLAEAGVDYEEVDVGPWHLTDKPPQFLDLKASGKLAFGKLPLWEEPGGARVVQSGAILRHIARKTGLHGRDALEAAACDEIIDAVEEVVDRARAIMDAEPAKLAELLPLVIGEELPRWLEQLDRIVKNNPSGFFVGSSVTVADTTVFSLLEMLSDNGLSESIATYSGLSGFLQRMKQRPGLSRYLSSPRRHPPQLLVSM
ncbi:glutathione S-transferase [Sorangium sp. So ce291]|uniref:glutathione S-transferase family protein n=1 Tax=Sorangium sp. So ce291 TaxID=3133294 RepID=UPI003F6147C0